MLLISIDDIIMTLWRNLDFTYFLIYMKAFMILF
jgi:hypothetical protein